MSKSRIHTACKTAELLKTMDWEREEPDLQKHKPSNSYGIIFWKHLIFKYLQFARAMLKQFRMFLEG